jgi:hypothetical protein
MKRKISGGADYILPIGVLVVGGYLVWKYVLSPGSSSGQGQNNSTTANATAAAAAADLANSTAAGSVQTLSDSTLNGIATSLMTLFSSFNGTQDSGNSQLARNLVIQINSLQDWNKLYSIFGTRNMNATGSWSSACSLWGYNCNALDLISSLRLYCTADDIAVIDSYLAQMGITNVVI